MAQRLPTFPTQGVATNAELNRLVRAIEAQLREKADLVDGKLYATDDQPVIVIGEDGTEYRLGKDAIPPEA